MKNSSNCSAYSVDVRGSIVRFSNWVAIFTLLAVRRHLTSIYRLGLKELNSLRRDPVLIILIVFTFTFAIYVIATGVRTEVRNASIAIVDEDHSTLSRQICAAFLQQWFNQPVLLTLDELDHAMDAGEYVFVIDIPHHFQAGLLSGRKPALQLIVDATAMTLAGNGAAYMRFSLIFEQTRNQVSV